MRHIVAIVTKHGSISRCQHCFNGVAFKSMRILSRLEVANIDAAGIILVGVLDALNVLRVYSLRLQNSSKSGVWYLIETAVHRHSLIRIMGLSSKIIGNG
jgi:hypothetical protein